MLSWCSLLLLLPVLLAQNSDSREGESGVGGSSSRKGKGDLAGPLDSIKGSNEGAVGTDAASEGREEVCLNSESRCAYRESNWHRHTMCCSSFAAFAGWVTPARISAPATARGKSAHDCFSRKAIVYTVYCLPKNKTIDVCLRKIQPEHLHCTAAAKTASMDTQEISQTATR